MGHGNGMLFGRGTTSSIMPYQELFAAEGVSDGESTRGTPSQDEGQVITGLSDRSDCWSDTLTSDHSVHSNLGLCRGRKTRCPRGYRAKTGCDGLCWLCYQDRPGWWLDEDEHIFQERSVNDLSTLPSLGSA